MASLEQMPANLVATFTQLFKIFKIIGLDFNDDPKACFVNRCRYIWFVVMLLLFFTGQVLYIVKADEIGADFLDIGNAIPALMLVLQDIFKIAALSKKRHIRRIILEINALWPIEMENKEKKALMDGWLRNLKMFNDCVYKYVAFSVSVFIIWGPFFVTLLTLAKGEAMYQLPFQLYYPFKIDSVWRYSAAFLHQAVVGTIIPLCLYVPCDLLLFTLTVDICILIRLLQYDLENITVVGRDTNEGFDPTEANKSYQALIQLARTHQKLLEISGQLNEVFGAIIFAVVLLSSVILCFFGFLTVEYLKYHEYHDMKYQLLRNIFAVVVTFFIVFNFALPGQVLSDASQGVADAAYNSLWYKSDLKFRKIIFIIIARSQKPCQLSGLGYTHLNFNTLSKVFSTAWSYLSLLNQMYQDIDQ